MLTRRSREGYLLIDHRNSPGVPEAMAQAAGLDPRALGAGKLFESATITCGHCGGIVVLNPNRSRERGHCMRCDAYICDVCTEVARTEGCTPLAKTLDLMGQQPRTLPHG